MLLVSSYFSRIKGYFHSMRVKAKTLDKLKYFDLAGGEQFEDPGFTYPTISQLQEIEDGNYDFENFSILDVEKFNECIKP